MFHMEQFFVLVLGVAVAPLPCSAEFFSAEAQPQEKVVCGGDICPEAERLTNLGLEFFLCGDTTAAREAFRQADATGNTSPLNDVGHILCAESKEARTAALAHLNEKVERVSMTPQEEFFLKALLLFINGDTPGAAEEFLLHAEQYRNDRLSRAWGILLLHYVSNDEATQQRVLSLASEFYTRFPKSGTAAYLRALSEEFFPKEKISDEALAAAATAATEKQLPTIQMLHGHLLFRAGRIQEASDVFHVIRKHAEKNSYTDFSAGLYEATALWCHGKTNASLQLRRELNAAITLKAEPSTDAERLWRWEINFLPLRVMVTRPEKITYTEIRAAKKAATTGQGSDELLAYRDCLVNLVLARYHAQKGKRGLASQFLKDAEGHYQRLQEKKSAVTSFELTLHSRACQACELGILTVRAELFEATSDTWKERKAELEKPASLLLPPVLPERI